MPVPHQILGKGTGTTHGLLGSKIIVEKEAGISTQWVPGSNLTA